MSSYQLPGWVWPTALIGATALVFWRGDRELRLSLGVMLAGWLLSIKTYVYGHGLQQGVFFVDTLVFAWFLWLGLNSKRYWPLFAAAFALLMVGVHIAKAVIPSLDAWTYLSTGILFSYMILASIAVGAWVTAPADDFATQPLPEPMATVPQVARAAPAPAPAPARAMARQHETPASTPTPAPATARRRGARKQVPEPA